MKKARFILTALILLAGVGGVFAFKVSRFTADPVQVTTNEITTVVGMLTYTAIAGFAGAPTLLCQQDFYAYWSVNGVALNAFSTLLATTEIPFTALGTTTTTTTTFTTTATIICGQIVITTTRTTTTTTTLAEITVTRTIPTCISTIGLATLAF